MPGSKPGILGILSAADSRPILKENRSEACGHDRNRRSWISVKFEPIHSADRREPGHQLTHNRSHKMRFNGGHVLIGLDQTKPLAVAADKPLVSQRAGLGLRPFSHLRGNAFEAFKLGLVHHKTYRQPHYFLNHVDLLVPHSFHRYFATLSSRLDPEKREKA